jgi:hypothetical protein
LEKFRYRTYEKKENVDGANYASQVAHALTKTIKSSAETMEDECPICLDCPLIHEAVISPCAHIFCRDCLVGILKKNAPSPQDTFQQCPDGICPSCNDTIDAKRIIVLSRSSNDDRVTTSYLADPQKPIKYDLINAKTAEPSVHLAARKTLENALRGSGSSKLTAVIN